MCLKLSFLSLPISLVPCLGFKPRLLHELPWSQRQSVSLLPLSTFSVHDTHRPNKLQTILSIEDSDAPISTVSVTRVEADDPPTDVLSEGQQ